MTQLFLQKNISNIQSNHDIRNLPRNKFGILKLSISRTQTNKIRYNEIQKEFQNLNYHTTKT